MANKLEIIQLSKQYGDFWALSNVSFTLEPGVTGLLGANGAGKSTLMKLMTDHMERHRYRKARQEMARAGRLYAAVTGCIR